jgi:hypothetical protein
VPPDGYKIPNYHAPRGYDGTHGSTVWCDNAGTRCQPVGVSRPEKGGTTGRLIGILSAARAGAHRPARHPLV